MILNSNNYKLLLFLARWTHDNTEFQESVMKKANYLVVIIGFRFSCSTLMIYNFLTCNLKREKLEIPL